MKLKIKIIKSNQITLFIIHSPLSLASSTKIISFKRARGERFITLQTVRNNVVQASLWNTITIEVVGSFEA